MTWPPPTDLKNDNNSEILKSNSQPNVSIIRSSNKRLNPDIPDALPATQQQSLGQIRVEILSEICVILTPTRRSMYQEQNITDKVPEALASPAVLNKIIPVLPEKLAKLFPR